MTIRLPLVLSLLAGLCFTQDNRKPDPNNQFIYPPLPGPQVNHDATVYYSNENITYGVKQAKAFEWRTNMTDVYILMMQEGNPDLVTNRTLQDCTEHQSYFYWDGEISPIDLAKGNIAFLGVWNCTGMDDGTFTGPIFFSHYFNLTSAKDSTAQATGTSTSTGAATTSSSASSSHTAAVSASSHAAALGGGIGGGVGGALVLVTAGVLFYMHRSKQQRAKTIAENSSHSQMSERYFYEDRSDMSNSTARPVVPSELQT